MKDPEAKQKLQEFGNHLKQQIKKHFGHDNYEKKTVQQVAAKAREHLECPDHERLLTKLSEEYQLGKH